MIWLSQIWTWLPCCAVPVVGPGSGMSVSERKGAGSPGAGGDMKRFHVMALAVLMAVPVSLTTGLASAAKPESGWDSSVAFTNVVASSPTTGGGYPIPPGARVPDSGTCRQGPFDANHSESWLAVKPGTEDLVGTSKFFFDHYSTFYIFYLGAYQMPGGTP